METALRSWVKSLCWRIIGIALLGGIAFALTGNWKDTGLITLLFHSIRVVTYYWHERLWNRIRWGRIEHPLTPLSVRADLTSEDYQRIDSLLRERGYSGDGPEYEI